MSTLLDTILEPGALTPMVQPIFKVEGHDKTLHSLECLMRGPKGTSIERADIMFAYVRRKGEEAAVDRACVRTAIQATAVLPFEPRISVNVHASTFAHDAGFVRYLKGLADVAGIDLARVTVEIIEHAPSWDAVRIGRALDEMRAYGMSLAVDDVGAGQSNYNMILDCKPEALKVDAYVIKGSHADKNRRAVLESITTLAQRFGCQIIAEGIEEAADLEVLLGLGINLIQGYMLARPMSIESLLKSGLLMASRQPYAQSSSSRNESAACASPVLLTSPLRGLSHDA